MRVTNVEELAKPRIIRGQRFNWRVTFEDGTVRHGRELEELFIRFTDTYAWWRRHKYGQDAGRGY